MKLKITLFHLFVVLTVIISVAVVVWAIAVSQKLKTTDLDNFVPANTTEADIVDSDVAVILKEITSLTPSDKPLSITLADGNVKTDFVSYKNNNATANTTTDFSYVNLPPEIIDNIKWIKPQKISKLGFFGVDVDQTVDNEKLWENPELYPTNLARDYYFGGYFNYNGQPGYIVYAGTYCTNCGPGWDDVPYYTFVLYNNQVTILMKHILLNRPSMAWGLTADETRIDRSFVKVDRDLTIPYLDFPDDASIIGKGQFKLARTDMPAIVDESAPSDGKKTFMFSVVGLGDWYLDDLRPAFFQVIGRDGLTRRYEYVPSIAAPVAKDEHGLVAVTLVDSGTRLDNYSYYESGSCRSYGSPNIYAAGVADINKDLQVVGSADNGDKIYELKDKNHDLLKSYYDNTFYPGQEDGKLSYEEFIAKHPMLFWMDPFGRLTILKSSSFQPFAECGKPVIYLYPPKTTKVKVKLALSKLSVSEPEYGNGWEVVVKPNGELTEIKSGAKYPYLFWEGLGAGEADPITAGFNVKKENVSKFLDEKLAAQGLNQKEIFDFKEFWLPKMQSAPYYFVTFYGTADMNKIAPLAVSPKPDTVIRVLMDYRAVSAPLNRPEQKLFTLPRQGFTVIEWGGVLYR